MSGSPRIARRGAADLIADDLREQILRGELAPGDPLKEAELAAAYAVARNTVREALRLLTRERIAVHEVHRGVVVRRFDAQEVAENFAVRALLEQAAVSRVGTLSADERAAFDAILRTASAAAAAGDWREVYRLNLQFHRQLVTLVHNARLQQLFDELLVEIGLVLMVLGPDNVSPWPERNGELLRLLTGRDPDAFEAALRSYLGDGCAWVLEHMPPGEDRP